LTHSVFTPPPAAVRHHLYLHDALPIFSYLRPTMKPVMFCRNTKGVLRWQHSSMKWAPFWAASENRMPLLAMMPTGMPWIWAKPRSEEHTSELQSREKLVCRLLLEKKTL